jgi:predicted nucleic acid-binding protein
LRSEGAAVLYFDIVVLSTFALAGRVDLLVARYGARACVTAEVLGEVTAGLAIGSPMLRAIIDAVENGSLGTSGAVSSDEREILASLLRVLSPGEASCIACARVRGGIVATDDRAARGCCRDHRRHAHA